MTLYQQPDALKLISTLWAVLAAACYLFFAFSHNASLKPQGNIRRPDRCARCGAAFAWHLSG